VTTKKPKRRRRDSHVKTSPAKAAAEKFIEVLTTNPGKGAITKAAQVAYPNQTRGSAATTGHMLLKDPYVQEQVKIRQQACRQLAAVTRDDIIGMLMAIIYGSHDDVLGKNGEIDWEKARERGIAHLIQDVERTERHSKDGARRVTTKYRLPSKIQAMDLLSEMTGWKRERAKNPVEAAKEVFRIMRQKDQYRDMDDRALAAYPAQNFNVSIDEILIGMEGT
jgi:hypothetical protein